MWKKGRKSSTTPLSVVMLSASVWRMFAVRFWCVSITPFGRPVVPLEYGSTARSFSGSIATGSGSPPAPDAMSQTFSSSRMRSSFGRLACASFTIGTSWESVKTSFAPASRS